MQTKNLNRKQTDSSDLIYGKVPPQSKSLEESVLGAITLDTQYITLDLVSEILKPEYFYVDAHQRIFRAMQTLNNKRQPIDLLTLVEQLTKTEEIEMVGGPYAVVKLQDGVVSTTNVESHARIILQKFLARELIRVGAEIINAGYQDSTDIFELLDKTEMDIARIKSGNVKENYRDLKNIIAENIVKLEELRQRDESITGVTSGFNDLDMVTCGWQETDLIILAARPSVGKTAFALTLAKNAGKAFQLQYNEEKKTNHLAKQRSVGFFSLEMKDSQLVNRVLAQESDVWLWRFKNGKLDDEQMKNVYNGAERLNTIKIFVDDTASLPIGDFRTRARQMKRKDNVGIIFVDYLQLMKSPGIKFREQEISSISQELKATAKELNIPIIALSQLSRDIEKTGSKIKREPQLSDIRESGAIEQDADMVMFLYRPQDFEIAEDAGLKDTFYCKIEKHRSGALAKFIGKFTGEDQKHHYLKVVDNTSLLPIGGNWKPIQSTPANNYYEPKEKQEENPF